MISEPSQKRAIERYFFDIPVFRTDISTYKKEWDNKIEVLADNLIDGRKEWDKREAKKSAESWLKPEWSSYRYGDLVGMIRLYAMTQQIRGEMYFVKQRISRSLKRKDWCYLGKIFEWHRPGMFTNEEIFDWILNRLSEENKKGYFKKKHIDTEAFENAGPHIDFLSLI